MTVSINEKIPRAQGISRDLRLSIVEVDIDSETYNTGGIDFDYENYVRDDGVVILPSADGYVFAYDYDDKKIVVYYADYDAGEDGELIEYEDGASLTIPDPLKVIVIGTD